MSDLQTRVRLETRVRLAGKVRLRFDERSGKQILLYPERGLELSDSAARIAGLCQQERQVSEVVDAIVETTGGVGRDRIEADVLDFLRALEGRGLLVVGEGA